MSNMHKLPYELVKDYAEQDVNLTLRLWNLFYKMIHQPRTVSYQGKTTSKTLANIFELETNFLNSKEALLMRAFNSLYSCIAMI